MITPFFEDTITAISTPPGEGGVGIVRLSGPRAIEIASQLFVSSRGRDIQKCKQRVFHGHVCDGTGRVLDETLLHIMRAPHSYTAEDVVEINAHGGTAPMKAILEETLRLGARIAQPGEFTRRAFINGRLDLSRAEAVIALVQAKTRVALNVANAAADGVLSRAINTLREDLLNALAQMEAAVDFPEEDLPDLITPRLLERLRDCHNSMKTLEQSADSGMLLQEGVSIAIVGRPNVGKSSIFNALLRDARAIVSTEPGTTRDRIEETITLDGIPARIIDTAGVRATDHHVEAVGVERARHAAQQAGLLLFVVDATRPATAEDNALAAELAELDAPAVLVRNKIDLLEGNSPAFIAETHYTAVCDVSAETTEGLQAMEKRLAELLLGDTGVTPDSPMLFRAHQKDSMRRATACIQRLLNTNDASPELLALELREALTALGEITGESTPEDVLDRIFADFCIGK